MTREMICIGCPMGCTLTVEYEEAEIKSISGNTCPGGIKYATEEILCPKRILTTTVKVKDRAEMLSVKSSDTLSKQKLFSYMEKINLKTVTPPIKIGDIIIKDIETGVDITATKQID